MTKGDDLAASLDEFAAEHGWTTAEQHHAIRIVVARIEAVQTCEMFAALEVGA